MEKRGEKVILSWKDLIGYIPLTAKTSQTKFFCQLKLTIEMSDISIFHVFYGQFTIAVALESGRGEAFPYWAIWGVSQFESPFSAKIPEPG